MGLANFIVNWHAALKCHRSDESRILAIQKQRFRRLLHHTVKNSEFYQELYSGIDIDDCRLSDLPIVTKSAMMDNFDRFTTDSRLKLREIQQWLADKNNDGKWYLEKFLPIATSGSTGEYAVVVYHRKALELVQASLSVRHPFGFRRSAYEHTIILLTQLLSAKARIAAIAVARGNLVAIIKKAPAFHRFLAKLKILSMFDPIDQIVAALNEFQPDCLISYPFFFAILAREQLAGRLKIAFNHPLSFLAGGGEPLTEHTHRLALEAWNMRIQDDYGTAECYFMAASCHKFGRLHLMSDLCILEVVDGDYNPVPQGKYGEKILVTNLANFVQPIIRYEIEDVVAYAGHSCECGLPFPALLPIQGRTSDFLYFQKPQGGYERFHPYRFRGPLFYIKELHQYQIIQTARNELAFFYVPQSDEGNIEQQLRQTLEEALRQAGLESRVTLKLKRVETIARDDRSGKFQIIKSLGAPLDLDTALDRSTY